MKFKVRKQGLTPKVVAICVGKRRGEGKRPVAKAYLRKNRGVEGDAHAGAGGRQVALLDWRRVEALRARGINAEPGDFAENIDLEGINFAELEPGVILQLGPAILEITERGKSEWQEGDYSFRGIALTAREGVFGRVVRGGWVKKGDKVKIRGSQSFCVGRQ